MLRAVAVCAVSLLALVQGDAIPSFTTLVEKPVTLKPALASVHPRVFVTEEMVGHKLGEFAVTRIFRGHTTAKAAVPGA